MLVSKKISNFKAEFDIRHDFNSDEAQLLSERHPEITFLNIPTAWIYPIDEMLCKLRYSTVIEAIGQEYGQLIVIFRPQFGKQNQHAKHLSIVQECRDKIVSLDIDLYQLLFSNQPVSVTV